MTVSKHTRRAVLSKGAATLILAGTAGCLGTDSETATVDMTDDLAFAPETVRVTVGNAVTWTNESDVTHSVTAREASLPDGAAYFATGGFESEQAARQHINDGLISAGKTYQHTFEQAGTYDYYCIPHESSGMTGTVRVEEP